MGARSAVEGTLERSRLRSSRDFALPLHAGERVVEQWPFSEFGHFILDFLSIVDYI